MNSLKFRLSQGAYLRDLFVLYGRKWLWVAFSILILSLLASLIWDWRLLIVSLMIIFICIPMLMAFLYFYYGFRQECMLNILPHLVKISDDQIIIDVYRQPFDDEDEEEAQSDIKYNEPAFTVRVAYSSLGRAIIGTDSLVYEIDNGFIALTMDCFGPEVSLVDVYDLICNKVVQARD